MLRCILTLAALSAAACSSLQPPMQATPCESDRAVLDADFSGAAVAGCRTTRSGFVISIEPEDQPINPSPWYAFQLTPKAPGDVRVSIRYADAKHRYAPKRSEDGVNWTPLADDAVSVSRRGKRASLTIELADAPATIAGQELFVGDDYDQLFENYQGAGYLLTDIGASIEKRPIIAVSDAPLDDLSAGDVVLLIGRQHPPEVTGALAMEPFLETVFGDSELAKTFRARFRVIAIPLLNPDGVEHGYWRHNLGGVDLNRDWGPFTQPETQAVKALLDAIDAAPGADLKLMLDFHSTNRDVFYTQTSEDVTDPAGFTERWLDGAASRLGEAYPIERAERHQTDRPTSKNYVFGRFGAPAITYELGDHTDRELIARSAVVFAEEAMRALLETSEKEDAATP